MLQTAIAEATKREKTEGRRGVDGGLIILERLVFSGILQLVRAKDVNVPEKIHLIRRGSRLAPKLALRLCDGDCPSNFQHGWLGTQSKASPFTAVRPELPNRTKWAWITNPGGDESPVGRQRLPLLPSPSFFYYAPGYLVSFKGHFRGEAGPQALGSALVPSAGCGVPPQRTWQPPIALQRVLMAQRK